MEQDNRKYFYIVPTNLLESTRNITKIFLYGILISFINKSGYCEKTNNFLANKLGKKGFIISRYLSELKKEGKIKIKYNGSKRKIFINQGELNKAKN